RLSWLDDPQGGTLSGDARGSHEGRRRWAGRGPGSSGREPPAGDGRGGRTGDAAQGAPALRGAGGGPPALDRGGSPVARRPHAQGPEVRWRGLVVLEAAPTPRGAPGENLGLGPESRRCLRPGPTGRARALA